jgi:hypothetical protein
MADREPARVRPDARPLDAGHVPARVHPRAFTHGHMQQLNTVLCWSLTGLAEPVNLLPGAD